jgi:transcriptional regulator with XRE-family HTH domain
MNHELLKDTIQDRGVKVSVLADKIGISRQSLHMKLNGERSFDQGEIMAIKTTLRLSDEEFMEIFFNDGVDKLSREVKT